MAFKGVYEEFGGQISNFMLMEVKDTLVAVGYHAPGESRPIPNLWKKRKIQV